MKIQKVDVLMPSTSQYHVLHHFARKLFEAFVRTGRECRLLEGEDRLKVSYSSPPDMTIGFNGAIKMEDGTLFCDVIGVPHISCLVDPPYRFLEIIKSPNILMTCDACECCKMLETLGYPGSIFFPHAVEQDLKPDKKVKRTYDIVFLGTCIDFDQRRIEWRQKYSKSVVSVMEEAAEVALSDDEASFIPILLAKIDPWQNRSVYEDVELYIKGKDRFDLLMAIDDFSVHVFGASGDKGGWSKLLAKKRNAIVHDGVDYHEALAIMKRSKIVLNSSIKNKWGAHERVFSAPACGAVVVTNDNKYIRETFSHGEDILLYKCGKHRHLNSAIADLLGDDQRWSAIATSGRNKVLAHHTWDHRVKSLLAKLDKGK